MRESNPPGSARSWHTPLGSSADFLPDIEIGLIGVQCIGGMAGGDLRRSGVQAKLKTPSRFRVFGAERCAGSCTRLEQTGVMGRRSSCVIDGADT